MLGEQPEHVCVIDRVYAVLDSPRLQIDDGLSHMVGRAGLTSMCDDRVAGSTDPLEIGCWIQWMIAYELADWAPKVSTACDGSKALEWLRQTGSVVTLLDVMLPRLDGWEFVDRYRAITGGSAIPIILALAARNPELRLASATGSHREQDGQTRGCGRGSPVQNHRLRKAET